LRIVVTKHAVNETIVIDELIVCLLEQGESDL